MRAYNSQYDPPAPMLEVTVGSIVSSHRWTTVLALLDTGSDITAIPQKLADTLQLYPLSRLRLEDLQSETTLVLTYGVQLTINDLIVSRLEVILTGLDCVVLGRDVLNRCYVHLDGPDLAFDIYTSASEPGA